MSNKQILPPFEAYKGEEPYIFISYSHKDSLVIFSEIKRLSDLGYRIWYDEGIDPGNEWPEEIAKALNLCSFFVVFISSNAVNSKNVRNEINFALDESKPFLAIHIEDIPLPIGLKLRMGDIQAILKYRMIDSMYERKMDKVLPLNLKLDPGFLDQFPLLVTGLHSDVLYFDDRDNKIRNDEKAWSDLFYETSEDREAKKPRKFNQVILKTTYPISQGRLFAKLTTEFNETLTIISSIEEIRKEDVLISKGVSWEHTALDLVSELRNNNAIKQLLNCKRLVVNFQLEGALYIEMDDKGDIAKCRLIFDSQFVEDEWWKNFERKYFGKTNLPIAVETDFMQYFSASIVGSFKDKTRHNFINLETSISEALLILRKTKLSWYLDNVTKTKFSPESFSNEIELRTKSQFASAFVPIPLNNQTIEDYLRQNWTILEGNYKPSNAIKPEPLFDTAFRFALYGESELANSPYLKIGNLLTYDRREIEEFRNATNSIENYLKSDIDEKPFSMSVFGSPGSDKLFLIKQLARHFELPYLYFNLSQISEDGLVEVFDQITDITLDGKVPIIHLDEFDCKEYKWIQQLLITMQSGKYNDGRKFRPIRKSIFIFNSSTSFSFWTFGIEKPEEPCANDILGIKNYEIKLNSYNDYILKKGPDFKRQISGCYLNIYGPNPIERLEKFGKIIKDNYGNVVYNIEDIFYPVRRALFIRRWYGKRGNDVLNIDYGLLNALIKVSSYFDSESFGKILSHLITKNYDKLRKSNLPMVNLLYQLVSRDFIHLMEDDKFLEFEAFKIARQIHNNWMRIGDKQGWKLEFHKDFNLLPAHMKDEHTAGARRIQRVLDALKPLLYLRIVPKNEADFYEKAEFDKFITDPELIERMAIEEHNGWMKTKVHNGWAFGLPRNDDKKIHNCIIGWDEEKTLEDGTIVVLFDKNKHMYKDTIMHFPEVLKEAGFVIVKEKL